jgi:DNA modification methylase
MVMKPGSVFYIWHADSEGYNFRGAFKDSGWTILGSALIWVKGHNGYGSQDYHWKHEPFCMVGKMVLAHLWACGDRNRQF